MSRTSLTTPFPWTRYSKKLVSCIERPRAAGVFTKKDAENRGMRLAVGSSGSIEGGNYLRFYWLVDPEDGALVDVKFQVFGQSALIGAAQAASEALIGKNYDQARRLPAELIDQQVRDKPNQHAFPDETAPHLNLALEAIDEAAEQCTDLPLPTSYVAPPVSGPITGVIEGGYPGWEEMGLKKRLALIEQVIGQDVRPYIEMDAGGVEVLNLLNEREVIIAYQGACTSCFSATGATLSYIQQVLRAKVHPDLIVIPEM